MTDIDLTPATELTQATRDALLESMERLSDLRAKPITPGIADEIDAVRYRGARLARRLELLEADGLLTMGAHRSQAPGDVLVEVVEEVREECERRGIRPSLEAPEAPCMWFDEGQLREALRCAVDDVIARVGRDGRLDVHLQSSGDSVLVRLRYEGGAGEGDPIARGLLHHLVHRMSGTASREQDGQELVLSVPCSSPHRASGRPRPDPRQWVFPAPTAA